MHVDCLHMPIEAQPEKGHPRNESAQYSVGFVEPEVEKNSICCPGHFEFVDATERLEGLFALQ